MTIRRTLVTALAAAALVAPAAQAQPADMHASTAQAAAKAAQQPKQDLRTPDARDAAVTLHRSVHVVKAPPAMAADGGGGGGELAPAPAVNAPGATAVDSASELPPAGQPTWPVNPSPIVAPAPQAVSDGSPVPVIPLVGAALLVLIAAFSARPLARHMARRTRVA